jgi:hypothetical protein
LDIRQESRKNNNQQKKKEKKESITLAFDKFVLDDIRKDATDAGVSVNSKINEIMKDYVRYQKIILKEHPLITFPPLFADLIKYLSEEAIIETSLMSIDRNNPFLLAIVEEGGGTINTLKRMLDLGLRLGLCENFSLVEKAGYFTLVLSHHYGIKWSKGISISFTKMIEGILNVHPTSEITPEKIIMRIPTNGSDSPSSYWPYI